MRDSGLERNVDGSSRGGFGFIYGLILGFSAFTVFDMVTSENNMDSRMNPPSLELRELFQNQNEEYKFHLPLYEVPEKREEKIKYI